MKYVRLVPSSAKTVIDIGCGTGNITDRIGDYISVGKTIGIDKSDDMIAYATSHHAPGKSITYFSGDICAIDTLDNKIELESADIVLSIHCMHWIVEEKQGRAMANIRNLLKPGGICYLLLFSWSDMLPLQEQLVYHSRWRKYFKEVIEDEERNAKHLDVTTKETERRRRRSSAPFPTFDPPPPHQRIHAWKQRCSDLFFEDIHVSLHNVDFDFGDWQSFQGTNAYAVKCEVPFVTLFSSFVTIEELKSICHFLPYIPQEEQAFFLEDYYDHVKNTYVATQRSDQEESILRYEYMLVQVKKPQVA